MPAEQRGRCGDVTPRTSMVENRVTVARLVDLSVSDGHHHGVTTRHAPLLPSPRLRVIIGESHGDASGLTMAHSATIPGTCYEISDRAHFPGPPH